MEWSAAGHVGTAVRAAIRPSAARLLLAAKQNRHQPKPMAIAKKILN
jgi:hypothetical protein